MTFHVLLIRVCAGDHLGRAPLVSNRVRDGKPFLEFQQLAQVRPPPEQDLRAQNWCTILADRQIETEVGGDVAERLKAAVC